MKTYYSLILLLIGFATLKSQPQTCGTAPRQQMPPTALAPPDPSLDYCAPVKIEVDYTTVQMYGGLIAAQNAIEPVLSDVATLYRDASLNTYGIDLGMEFEVFYWDSPSGYQGNSTSNYLNSFRSNHQPHDKIVSQLLVSGSSGGIAYVGAACNSNFGVSVSNIINQRTPYPGYSWNVMVIAHELGHNFGSNHTHACVWNGNNTAIDGCAGGTEGGCPNPGSPAGGGTVMSYCHFTTGIDFSQGFGMQPMAVILNGIAGASCATCTDNPPPPPPPPGDDDDDCEGNELLVQVQLDYWPLQSYWELTDEQGELTATNGPWEQSAMNRLILDTLCVPDGCYTFTMYDIEGNGLGALGCSEGMYIVQSGTEELASGQVFAYEESTQICFGEEPESSCTEIDFTAVQNHPTQHHSSSSYTAFPDRLKMTGNTWKVYQLPDDFEVTDQTTATFSIKIEEEGEIHGIGFSVNPGDVDPNQVLRIAGNQNWGNGAYDDGIISAGFRSYNINMGNFIPDLDYRYLLLINDEDGGPEIPVTTWKDLTLCNGTDELTLTKSQVFATVGKQGNEGVQQYSDKSPLLYPNPTNDTIHLPNKASYWLYNGKGQLLKDGNSKAIDVSMYPPGLYFIWWEGQTEEFIKK